MSKPVKFTKCENCEEWTVEYSIVKIGSRLLCVICARNYNTPPEVEK